MRIIVGLGNPGEKYQNTRHNVGFLLLDYIADRKKIKWKLEKKFNALVYRDGDKLYLKPLTYMNESGNAVRAAVDYYKIFLDKEEQTIHESPLQIIHDEIDIEFGKIKNSINRGPAGHNGIKSIINHLNTKNFERLRIGVKGKHYKNGKTEKYVMSNFTKEEIDTLYKDIFPSIKF